MRPVMSDETSTFRLGSILPLAVTIDVRSRFVTFSRRTSVEGWRRLAAPQHDDRAQQEYASADQETAFSRLPIEWCPFP